MRDGIYSFNVTSRGTGIAIVENNTIKGLTRNSTYISQPSTKYGEPCFLFHELPFGDPQGFFRRGFPAKLLGEEGENHFKLSGESEGDSSLKVTIQGQWLCNLPQS
jgi:hypothetical protein